jgi:hypothetical protein
MGIKLVPKFSKEEIRAALLKRKEGIEQAIFFRLQKTGEEFVTNARNNGSYKDRTGNLRSSVGYVIMKDGKQLFDNFKEFPAKEKTTAHIVTRKKGPQVDPGLEAFINKKESQGLKEDPHAPQVKKIGMEEAQRIINEQKKKFPSGLVLIVVAGMEYAAAVESRGYDVLSSSSITAEQSLKTAMEKISKKLAE